MSQCFHNNFIFSCDGSQFDSLLFYFWPIRNLHLSNCEKYYDNNKMSQHFHNTIIFSCDGSWSNNLLFYLILIHKECTCENIMIITKCHIFNIPLF